MINPSNDPPGLTARQIVASTLLGVDPPRLPSSQLVQAGALFGIAEGTVRVALSRMVRAGELVAEDGSYRLTGQLLTRQARQAEGRRPDRRAWDGQWELRVVPSGARPAAERSGLRAAMLSLRFGELREGVWLRPANLDPDRLPEARRAVAEQCLAFRSGPPDGMEGAELARALWDLAGWAARARRLEAQMDGVAERLANGDDGALREGWELSAAVLRHLVGDPLLPDELVAGDWPGDHLRATYDGYDAAFKATWRRVFRLHHDGDRGS